MSQWGRFINPKWKYEGLHLNSLWFGILSHTCVEFFISIPINKRNCFMFYRSFLMKDCVHLICHLMCCGNSTYVMRMCYHLAVHFSIWFCGLLWTLNSIDIVHILLFFVFFFVHFGSKLELFFLISFYRNILCNFAFSIAH